MDEGVYHLHRESRRRWEEDWNTLLYRALNICECGGRGHYTRSYRFRYPCPDTTWPDTHPKIKEFYQWNEGN